MKSRFQIATTLTALAAAAVLWAGAAPALSQGGGAAVTTAQTSSGAALAPKPIGCRDLPISSALIDPSSCWDTGTSSMLVAGSTPRSSRQGAVAVISGQTVQLASEPGAGALQVVSASKGTACLQGAAGGRYTLQMAGARLTSLGAEGCTLKPSSQPTADTSAELTSNEVEQSSNQASTAVPPPVTPSYYEYGAYVGECPAGATSSCPLYSQGRATVTPSGSGIVVLDFGAPCSNGTASSGYGTQLFESSACTSDASLEQLVQEWINGYESDHGAGTSTITLAVGTSNSENGINSGPKYEPASLSQSADSWYQLVSASYSRPGSAPIVTWGASDLEQAGSGWWDSSDSVTWVKDYAQAAGFSTAATCALSSPGFLADYGDDIVGGSGSDDGWSAANVYAVAQGTPGACALPEIYYDSMAAEWSALSDAYASSSGSPGIEFTGVMVEAVSGTLSASAAWSVLESDTGQSPALPAITQIAPYGDFQVQGDGPQVTAVSPAYGPSGGGTTVKISGANLGGAEQVYFGSVAATSFSVISAGSISAVAPPGSVGTVNVEVETAIGSSSAVPADQFLYTGPPCTAVSVTVSPATVDSGLNVLVSGSASCSGGAPVKYSYFTKTSASASWTLRDAWVGASWSWSTSGLAPGDYQVLVWASDGPYTVPQVQQAEDVTVVAPVATVAACSKVALTVPSSAAAGSSVPVTASATCPAGAAPKYSYFTRSGTSGSWTLRAAWVGASWSWSTLGLAAGSYQVLAWASDGPYTVPQVQQAATISLTAAPPCTGVTVSVASTAEVGAKLAVTASGQCPAGSKAEYSYFTRAGTSGSWTLRAAWVGTSWSWSTLGLAAGTYQVLAWASDGPYTVPQVQQATTISLTAAPPCTGVTVSVASTAKVGVKLAVTASGQCPAGSKAEYSYFTRSGTAGSWTLRAAWTGASWSWPTAGLPAGTNQVLVWISNGPYTVPQAQIAATVALSEPASCTSVSVTATPASPTVGQAVAVSATATCPAGASARYSYFLGRSASGPWVLKDAWVGSSWTLPTSGLQAGTYYVLAWATDGPLRVPQVQEAASFKLAALASCTKISVSVAHSSVAAGATVVVEASATCPAGASPKYSYFTSTSASGPWTLRDAWTGASWSWSTARLAPGTYHVLVWASDGPHTVPQVESSAAVTVG